MKSAGERSLLAGAAGAGKSCGFDFVEMSVDETDERLSRLDWSAAQRASLVTAMIERVLLFRQCACPHIVVFLLVAGTTPCASGRGRL